MGRNVLTLACAGLLATVVFACSGDNGSTAERAREGLQEAAEAAKDKAGELHGNAEEMLASWKTQWSDELGGLETRFTRVKESAAELDDAELDGYVAAIETKLTEAKEAITSAASGGIDLDAVRESISGRMAELAGLLQAAEDKAAALSREE